MARILIVDDEPDMRMALANVFNRMGHRVFEAPDGPAALKFFSREKVDLVLLDIRLPGMDGIEILRKLRESDKTTPVIMVTGYGSVESAVEVMQLGASHYLAKPFSNHELKNIVEKALSGQEVPARGPIARRGAQPPILATTDSPLATVIETRSGGEGSWLIPTAVMAGIVLIMVFWSLMGTGVGSSVAMSHENPTAIVWKKERLWTADWLTQTLYEQKLTGGRLEVLRTFPLPQTHITGLAVSDDYLYVCDSWKKVIQKRRLDDTLTLVRTSKSPGPNPSGLFWDGRYLWSSDASEKRFYQHETEADLSVLASYPAPGNSPSAIFKNDSYFWSADAESRRLYQHRLDEKLGVLATYAIEILDEGPTPLSSFTWKGDKIWFARDGTKTLQVHPLSAFRKIEKEKATR